MAKINKIDDLQSCPCPPSAPCVLNNRVDDDDWTGSKESCFYYFIFAQLKVFAKLPLSGHCPFD